MVMRRIIFTILAVLIPTSALGFWSIYEVQPDEIRKRPWIIILSIGTNNETKTIYFNAIFDHQDAYLHLDLRDENDTSISSTPLRGEAIHRAMPQESARHYGLVPLWEKGTATSYKFTVNSQLLNKSKLSWQFGSPTDQFGLPSTGGVVEWCHLSALVQAGRNTNKVDAANGGRPIRPETDRTASPLSRPLTLQSVLIFSGPALALSATVHGFVRRYGWAVLTSAIANLVHEAFLHDFQVRPADVFFLIPMLFFRGMLLALPVAALVGLPFYVIRRRIQSNAI